MCTQWERETKGCVLVCFCFVCVSGCMVICSTLTLQQQYTPTAAVPHGAPSWSWPGQRALESWALFQAGDGLGEDEEDKDENEEEAVLRVTGYTDTSTWTQWRTWSLWQHSSMQVLPAEQIGGHQGWSSSAGLAADCTILGPAVRYANRLWRSTNSCCFIWKQICLFICVYCCRSTTLCHLTRYLM